MCGRGGGGSWCKPPRADKQGSAKGRKPGSRGESAGKETHTYPKGFNGTAHQGLSRAVGPLGASGAVREHPNDGKNAGSINFASGVTQETGTSSPDHHLQARHPDASKSCTLVPQYPTFQSTCFDCTRGGASMAFMCQASPQEVRGLNKLAPRPYDLANL